MIFTPGTSSSIAVTIRFPLIFLPWPATEPAKASKAQEERNDERDKRENLGRCHGLPLQLFANAAIPASRVAAKKHALLTAGPQPRMSLFALWVESRFAGVA